jgi:uncharacterized coiled-coil DUF342 family protein
MLQCHAIVEQFVKLDFKGHTTMVQQMTLYMMTKHVDPAQMTKLVTTMEGGHKSVQEAVKQVKQLADLIDKLKAESAAAKRKANDLSNQLETLKKGSTRGSPDYRPRWSILMFQCFICVW